MNLSLRGTAPGEVWCAFRVPDSSALVASHRPEGVITGAIGLEAFFQCTFYNYFGLLLRISRVFSEIVGNFLCYGSWVFRFESLRSLLEELMKLVLKSASRDPQEI